MSLSHRAYCGRFAPSPTGPLHFGSLVCALASFLDARAHDGTWLIRIEDIDPPRDIPGADEAIIRTLTRLGMVSDIPVVWQSRLPSGTRLRMRVFAQRDRYRAG